jgi:VCBS repeat-containing protein
MAVLTGNGSANVINGTNGIDLIFGLGGDDQLFGGDGSDLVEGGNGNDSVDGGAGNDIVDGGKGNDTVNGGAGSDIASGGDGNDILVYIASENVDATDLYFGGRGTDTLRLVLTSSEAAAAAADIAAFQSFLAAHVSPSAFIGPDFTFSSLGLTVRGFEQLEIVPVGNDAPVITSGGQKGQVFEDGDDSPKAGSQTTSGVVTFTDADLSDVHTSSFAPSPSNTTSLGTFALGPLTEGGGTGAVVWSYTIDNVAAQNLASGESKTEFYTVTIEDGNGGSATEQVAILIRGANDPVLVTSGAQSGAVEEDGTLAASGTIAFSDIDLADLHTQAFTPSPSNTSSLGTFSLGTLTEGGGTGSVEWSYDLDNAAAQSLAAGEVVTETYTVTIDDGHGSIATQDVVINITGAGGDIVQVTNTPGDDQLHDISGDGRYLTWSAPTTNGLDLFWTDLENPSVVETLGEAGDQTDPHISADGQRVSFTNVDDATGVFTVLVWEPTTGLVTDDPTPNTQFLSEISGDGNHVVSTTLGVGSQIFMWNLGSGTSAPVSLTTQATNSTVSGDGNYIAYEDNSFGPLSQIVLLDVNDPGNFEVLGDPSLFHRFPAISADGNYVAWQSSVTATTGVDIHLFDRAAGTTTIVAGGSAEQVRPSISGDGRFVTYSATDAGETDIYVWDREDNETTLVASLPGIQQNPQISEDGRYISYESNEVGGQFDVYRADNPLHDDFIV